MLVLVLFAVMQMAQELLALLEQSIALSEDVKANICG